MSHILIDCERMKYPYTGLYTFCHELGNALLKIAGDELCFYLPGNQRGHFGDVPGYLRQRSIHKFFPPRQRFDLWHSTYQNTAYHTPYRRTKNVITVHDLNFLHEAKSDAKKKKYLRKLQQNINRADHIVTISRFVEQEVRQYLHIGDRPVEVIYNGSSVQEFPGYDAPAYMPAKPFLLCLGVLLPKKNFHVVPCLLKGNDMELVIAGVVNEDYKQQVLQEAARHGVADRVKIVGAVTAQDKYWYLKNCQAFIFPSLAEGFGLPVIEAMHFGKPVFLSTHTCLPEIGGEQAYYFSNFDPESMQAVFENGMQQYAATQPQASIMQRAHQFNWNKTASAYMTVYRNLLS